MKKVFSFNQVALFFIGIISSFNLLAFDSYQSFKNDPLSLNLDFQMYKTEANFNSRSEKQPLISGNSFQFTSMRPQMRWQMGSDFAFLAGTEIGISESVDSYYTRRNSVLNKLNFGVEYLFLDEAWLRTFLRLIYSNPLEKVNDNSDNALTSNGASEFRPEVVFNFDFENDLYTFLKGGLNVRGQGLSTLATYGAGAEFRFTDLGLGASLLGYLTIKNDSQSSYQRDNFNNRVNAGSKIFNSSNPSQNSLEFNFNILLRKQSQLKFFAGLDLIGSNSSSGYYLGANINWVFEGFQNSNSTYKSKSKSDVYDPNFKIKTDDGVNQDYFKPVTPITNDYIQQIEGQSQQPTVPEDSNYKIKLKKKKNKK